MDKLNVLVVDDEPGIRSGVSRILNNFSVSYPFMDNDYGFHVVETSTGEEAIELIKEQSIDIVLLDNKLPGIQGTDVLEYINKHKPEILVMMITSYASLELAVKATNQGAYDFIPKPFTPQELKSALENVSKHIFLRGMTRKLNKEGKEIRYQFLSVLSHELKAPLNAIEGYLKIMQERQAGEKIEDYDQMIDRSLHRISGMRNLIMDLLDLTKIKLEKKTEKFQQVKVREVAQNAIEAINPYAIQKDVQILLHDQKEIEINIDPGDLEIIFNNLISNAVKYNKQNGKVDVFIDKMDDLLMIKIKDTGIGLTDDEIKNLFEEFFRVKNEQTKHITGSGLGLPIVRKVLDIYQGDIHVESKVNEGSTFTVTLPA
ncbi:MAG: response regulator [Bacteroidales bacterium]|jgi:signal transduction histidine kinase|nr:response regulator [Bacteroidales bacterium]